MNVGLTGRVLLTVAGTYLTTKLLMALFGNMQNNADICDRFEKGRTKVLSQKWIKRLIFGVLAQLVER